MNRAETFTSPVDMLRFMVHLLPSRNGRLRERARARKRSVKRRQKPHRSTSPKHKTPTPIAAQVKPASSAASIERTPLPAPVEPAVIAASIELTTGKVASEPPPAETQAQEDKPAKVAVAEPPPTVREALPRAKDEAPARPRTAMVAGVIALGAAGGLFAFTQRPAHDPEPAPAAPASMGASAAPAPAGPAIPPRFAEELDVSTFQKGNIHTHTSNSDGDSAPQIVYSWYRDHGYNFLAVTDHNTFTNPKNFGWLEKPRSFVLLSGEEITMMGAGHQVHVNGLCTKKAIGGKHFDTQSAALAWAVTEVKAQGGVSLVNHPNWDWALTENDIPAARGASLVEIFSGHPFVRTEGDETRKSHEAIWDHALSRGELLAGAAVDDSHIFKLTKKKNDEEPKARPGRAWVEVFADEANRVKICEALGKGRLYSSSGVKLARIRVGRETYTLEVATKDTEVTFVGREGRVLQKGKTGEDGVASYVLRGGEGYVRAKVSAPDGSAAWTQPSFLVTEKAEAPGPPALLKPEEVSPLRPSSSAAPLLPAR
jgi:hypothetical protein